MVSVAFTGHRPNQLPFGNNENDDRCIKLKKMLRKDIKELIIKKNADHFITGMALGVDTYVAEIVIELRNKKYPNITLEAAIPCETQTVKWTETQKMRYSNIIERCDKKSLLQKDYTSDCMRKRNCYMVDHTDYLIAVWNGKPSGTGMTVKYAMQQGKEVIIIDPQLL